MLAGAATTAHAQGKPPTTGSGAKAGSVGMEAPGTTPGSSVPGAPSGTAPGPAQGGQTLSTQLSQSNGTLQPPAVDQGMQKTPTEPGTTPVIPPPGTAGGAPGAVAK